MEQPLSPLALTPISPLKRIALIVLGTFTLGCGIAGMFLPGVPTTVFLLITMACYVRSSDRLYHWVMTRRWLQKPIATAMAFQQSGVLPVRIKLIAQGVAWSSFVLVVFTGAKPVFQIICLVLAASCTIAMSIIKSDGEAWSPRAWRMDAGDIARQLWLGAQAGAWAGAFWGVATQTTARFAMRLAGAPLQISLQSMLLVMLGAVLAGALFGLLYAGVRRVLPRNKWLNGALFGAAMLLIVGAMLFLSPTLDPISPALLIAWLGVNFIAAGVILCLAFRSLEMRAAQPLV